MITASAAAVCGGLAAPCVIFRACSSTTHKPHSNSHHLLRNHRLNLSHHYNLPLVVSHTKPPLSHSKTSHVVLPRVVASLEQVEKSYVMVKPDGVQRGLVGEIISRFEKKGFKLIGLKLFHCPKQLAQEHYKDLKSKPFFPTLTEYITSGPVVCMAWEGVGVVASARKLIGLTNPLQAEPGTIRGDLAVQTGRSLVQGR